MANQYGYRSTPINIGLGLNADPLGRQLLDVKQLVKKEIKSLENLEATVNIRFKADVLNANGDKNLIAEATKRMLHDLEKISVAKMTKLEEKAFNDRLALLPSSNVHNVNQKKYAQEQLKYAQVQQELKALPKDAFDMFAGRNNRTAIANTEKDLAKLRKEIEDTSDKIKKLSEQQLDFPKKRLKALEGEINGKALGAEKIERLTNIVGAYDKDLNAKTLERTQAEAQKAMLELSLQTAKQNAELAVKQQSDAEVKRDAELANSAKYYDKRINAQYKNARKVADDYAKEEIARDKKLGAVDKAATDFKKAQEDRIKSFENQAEKAYKKAIDQLSKEYENKTKTLEKKLSKIKTNTPKNIKLRNELENNLIELWKNYHKAVEAEQENLKKILSGDVSFNFREGKAKATPTNFNDLKKNVQSFIDARDKQAEFEKQNIKNYYEQFLGEKAQESATARINQSLSNASDLKGKKEKKATEIENKYAPLIDGSKVAQANAKVTELQNSIAKVNAEIKDLTTAINTPLSSKLRTFVENEDIQKELSNFRKLKEEYAAFKAQIEAGATPTKAITELQKQLTLQEGNVQALERELAIRQKIEQYSGFMGIGGTKKIDAEIAKIQSELNAANANRENIARYQLDTRGINKKSSEEQAKLRSIMNEAYSLNFSSFKEGNDAFLKESQKVKELNKNLEILNAARERMAQIQPPSFTGFYQSFKQNFIDPVTRGYDKWMNLYNATQGGLSTALPKSFELLDSLPSFKDIFKPFEEGTSIIGKFTGTLGRLGTVAGGAITLVGAGAVALMGFEKTLENFARPALEAQNALYIMSLGMHSTVDDMKQLSVITQVAGVNMNSVQVAMRRVNAQLVKTSEGSKLARDTLKHYGADLFDKNGNIKQGMAQLDEIAKAYQNAIAQGKGAEFRYRVGGRYWDNDFVALIADYAANKEAMYKIVKSNLADPALAYNVRGSMYQLEAQEKQFQTAFASAFMPVVKDVAPQMKNRFAELTRLIEQNAPAIKGFGFALGSVIGKLSEFGTSLATAITKVLGYLDFGRTERMADEAYTKKKEDAAKLADIFGGVERNQKGDVVKYNERLGKVVSEGKLSDFKDDRELYRKFKTESKFAEESLDKAIEKQKKNSNIKIEYNINKDALKILDENRYNNFEGLPFTTEEIKNLTADDIQRMRNTYARNEQFSREISEQRRLGREISERGGLERVAARANLYQSVTDLDGNLDIEALKKKIVDSLEGTDGDFIKAFLDIDEEKYEGLKKSLEEEAEAVVKKELSYKDQKVLRRYREYEEIPALVEKYNSLNSPEEKENFKNRLNNLEREYLESALKNRAAFDVDLKNARKGAEDILDDIDEVKKQNYEKIANDVVENARANDQKAKSDKNEQTQAFSEKYESLLKKISDREKEIQQMELELQFRNYPLARSIAEVEKAYEEEVKIIEDYKETLKDIEDAEQRAKLEEEANEKLNEVEAYREKKQSLNSAQVQDEIKQSYKNAYDTIYNLSRSTTEQELRNNRIWLAEEKKKIALLGNEALTKQRLAAVTAETFSKEMDAMKKLKDEMRGDIQGIEEEYFKLTHSQFENEVFEIQKELTKAVEKYGEGSIKAQKAAVNAQLKLAKLIKENPREDNDKFYNAPEYVQDILGNKNPILLNMATSATAT